MSFQCKIFPSIRLGIYETLNLSVNLRNPSEIEDKVRYSREREGKIYKKVRLHEGRGYSRHSHHVCK